MGGCGNKGAVTFSIQAPAMKALNPVTAQVTEYALKHVDGTIVAVASEGPMSTDTLPLGPLTASMAPVDLQLQVLSGSTLLGMGLVKDVSFENGVQKSYDVWVRKPLLTIGSSVPTEPVTLNLQDGQIIDPTEGSADLTMMMGPKLPTQTVATAPTWDGRFLLAASGMTKTMDVIDTGSGKTVGSAPLGFVPAKVAVGSRNSAVAALDPAGSVLLYSDVDALTGNPGAATGMKIAVAGMQRTLTFSPDGQSLYVLSGSDADPCTGAAPVKNVITVLGLDGSMKGSWMLSGFVSDVAVDPRTNKVVITDATNGKISYFDAGAAFGAVMGTQIGQATCPSAVRVVNSEAFVVTSDRGNTDDSFVLQRIDLGSAMVSKVSFQGPSYSQNVTGPQMSPDGNLAFNFQLRPVGLYAADLAVTPDGARAVFAIRTRYREDATQKFQFAGESCTPNVDIIEYGLYTLDTATGTVQYTSRSQIVALPSVPFTMNDPNSWCVTCKLLGSTDIVSGCAATMGDKAAGLAAIFGGT
jgi:DNA-binding beta-propeller fold protein YncE